MNKELKFAVLTVIGNLILTFALGFVIGLLFGVVNVFILFFSMLLLPLVSMYALYAFGKFDLSQMNVRTFMMYIFLISLAFSLIQAFGIARMPVGSYSIGFVVGATVVPVIQYYVLFLIGRKFFKRV